MDGNHTANSKLRLYEISQLFGLNVKQWLNNNK
ncbi:hypothetical protein VAA_04212 [Vibrio anguillarum 775]|nr:hypothetical protein VAA_04212 [Vibrio anguillarum 775]AGU58785.1 hypothetical protein N175_03260 [Vibrio anguillarum M3]